MNWLYYLLEANLYLALFYGFYRLFLHQETFYVLNRYYLITSSSVAFLIPFLQLGFLSKNITAIEEPVYQQIVVEQPLLNTENILLFLHALIVLIFISKIAWGFRHIFKLLKKPNKKVENGITIIELTNTKAAFSFFNMLFIDPELPQKDTIMRHEMAHIHQKHSFDILFFELIRSLSWFNPIAHFLKSDIKLIHEYLADEETTNKGIEKYEYALFLIQNSYGEQDLQLTNQIFNKSILKRRISMLNQKKSAKWARLRLLLAIPLLGGMICISTMAFTKDYGVVDLYPKHENVIKFLQDTSKKVKAKEIRIAEPVQNTNKTKAKEIVILEPTQAVKKAKGVKLATPPPPPVAPPVNKKVKGVKLAPPPPPPVAPPVSKKVKGVKLVPPPPPPVEPTPTKNMDLTEGVVKGYPTKNGQIAAKPEKSKLELIPMKVKGYKTTDKTITKTEPAQKNDDQDASIFDARSASAKTSIQIKDAITKEIRNARSKVASTN